MNILTKLYNYILDIMQTVLLAASIFLIIYIFLFRPFQVSGDSMYPTYKNKEYILTNLISLKYETPNKGDVIVFKSPSDPDKDFIKRVVAIEGDTILLRDGFIYINGIKLDESNYLPEDTRTYGGSFIKEGSNITVPTNNFIVIGDNRAYSSDSREWGFLSKEKIIGNSMFVYWPLPNVRIIKNPFE